MYRSRIGWLDIPLIHPQQFIVFILCTGVVSRRCVRGGEWEEVFGCFKEETRNLLNKVIIINYTFRGNPGFCHFRLKISLCFQMS